MVTARIWILGLLSAVSAFDFTPKSGFPHNFTMAYEKRGKAKGYPPQHLDCYESPNCYGTSISINGYVPDLSKPPYYFDNRIHSCRFNGIWIFYDEINYNMNNLQVCRYNKAYLPMVIRC